MKIVLDDGMSFEAERLETEPWLSYLYYTEHQGISMERVDVVEQLSGRETLSYVLRTLEILEEDFQKGELSEKEREIVKLALEWAEVSKGGSEKERANWRNKGYALDIHNLASAEIYRDHASRMLKGEREEVVYLLICTHGLIGQALRGEVQVRKNEPLLAIKKYLDEESVVRVVSVLNHCIIGGISRTLWDEIRGEVLGLIRRVLAGDFTEFSTRERMRRLDERLTSEKSAGGELTELFEKEIFPNYEIWYYQAAFADLSVDMVEWILRKMLDKVQEGVSYLSFKALSDGLYYDYQGKKHLNVYKERIIEKYMRDDSVENVELIVKRVGRAMMADFRFTPVCEKLIDFCVEAERCGLLTFEKSITVLYDMFGFRRDAFDRLNNEEKYLARMNESEESTKQSITDYVIGKTVVDVGSGGGVLLDRLEEQYPQMQVIGTDISDNVLLALEEKRKSQGHGWTVYRQNFVEGPFAKKVDTIIFSSILHEIFSYVETENGRFEISSVKAALKNAYASLNPGGRLIIRDGVKSPVDDTVLEITFIDPAGMDFFKNYVRDFQGLKDIEDKKIEIFEKEGKVRACTNFAREFLYTYTWGQESYAHEVQEQFGYFTTEEYAQFLKSLGAELIRCDAFLEPGYVQHLSPKVKLSPDRYPDSNCIVVARKPL